MRHEDWNAPEEPRGDEPFWFDEPARDEEIDMPLNVKGPRSREFRRVPEGVHQAVCNLVADCGIQPGGQYGPRQQVYIRWEIPAERLEWTDSDGNVRRGPMNIGRFYTASLSEKATLRRDLENWRGRPFSPEELAGFDLFRILGTACQLMVAHTRSGEETYANVTGVMSFPKNQPRPAAEGPLIRYSPEEPAQFELLPRWLREKIETARRLAEDASLSQEPELRLAANGWRGREQKELPFG